MRVHLASYQTENVFSQNMYTIAHECKMLVQSCKSQPEDAHMKKNVGLCQEIVPEDTIKHPRLLNPCMKVRIFNVGLYLLTAEPNLGLHIFKNT